MIKRPFYFELKDMLIQFVAAFDDVVIGRFDKNRVEKSKINVRYVYSPKEKVLFDIVNKAQNLTLPVIAVNITTISRDETRVFNKLEGFYHSETTNYNKQDVKYTRQVGMPVPINITVNMSILTEYQTDMDQILSNFIPYSNPYIIISWKLPEEFGIGYIQEIRSEVLWNGNISLDYPLEQAANTKPRINAETSFTIKGWLFPDVPNDPYKNIFFINSNFYAVTGFGNTGKFTGYDEYNSLSAYNVALSSNSETISISAAPQLSYLYFAFLNNPYEVENNLTITKNNSGGLITLQGKMLQYTTSILLSSNVTNFYQNLTSLQFAHYPTVSGYILPTTNYNLLTPNIISLTLPALTANGNFDIVVINQAGWDSTKNAGIQLSKQ